MINMNDLARSIAQNEGLKESISIAQVKEVLRITLRMLKQVSLEDLIDLLRRIK